MLGPWWDNGGPMNAHDVPMVLPWYFRGGSVVGSWYLHGVPMVPPWCFCRRSVVSPWCFHGDSMVGPWWVYGGFVVLS